MLSTDSPSVVSQLTFKRGLIVILIGGEMTVDGGSIFDSRQPVDGDPNGEVAKRALANSLLWWETVSSLVAPILMSSGANSFALVLGPRTVVEVRPDGELRRARLRTLLPGGSTDLSIKKTVSSDVEIGDSRRGGSSVEHYDVRFARREEKWVFVDEGSYWLPMVTAKVKPAVIVDTEGFAIRGE